MKKKLLIITAITISLFLSGCGGTSIKTANGEVNVKDNKVELKTKDGKSEISIGDKGNAKLPEGYPKDTAPIIKGAKISLASKSEANNQTSFWVTYTSDKEITEVQDFYKDALKDVENKQTVESNNMFSIGGTEGDQNVYVTVTGEEVDGKMLCTVQLVVSPK